MKASVKYNDNELVKEVMERTEESWREAQTDIGEEHQDVIIDAWLDGRIALIVEVE